MDYKDIEIPPHQKYILERIKILFFGVDWEELEIVFFEDGQLVRSVIPNPHKVIRDTLESRKYKIVVVLMVSNCIDKDDLSDLIKQFPQEQVFAYFFYTENRKEIDTVIKVKDTLPNGKIELYGIDPDYFYSIVPISGGHHKIVERYILKLKTNVSVKSKIKSAIKNIMISLGLSKVIYEGYIIAISCLLKTKTENIKAG